MIRPIVPADTPLLVRLTDQTGVFKPMEVQILEEVLNDYHEVCQAKMGHQAAGFEHDGQLVGFTYHAPVEMTERTWSLWWIVVAQAYQAAGIGGQLLQHVEEDIRRRQGRVLFVETSSLPNYERSRRFYRKHGYAEAARLADYYSDGDDMVVFRKRLT
jgi:ribosomal protein S18 acetylase RimI-like enzyme